MAMGRDGRSVNLLVSTPGQETVLYQRELRMVVPMTGAQSCSESQKQVIMKSSLTSHQARGRPRMKTGSEKNAHAVSGVEEAVEMDMNVDIYRTGVRASCKGKENPGINISGCAVVKTIGFATIAIDDLASGQPLEAFALSPTLQSIMSNGNVTCG